MNAALDLAAKQIGLNETDKAVALRDYLTTGGANLDPATTAWCAAFVNSSIEQTGGKGTGSNMARSFLDWGEGVDKPQRGDIAVFSRGDPNGPFGHVGFFDGYNEDGTIRVLGGNQGDSVSVASYSPDRLLGFRRAGQPSTTPGVAQSPSSPGEVQLPPPNAMAQRQPETQPNALQLDPEKFMRQRNALALTPIQFQRRNSLYV